MMPFLLTPALVLKQDPPRPLPTITVKVHGKKWFSWKATHAEMVRIKEGDTILASNLPVTGSAFLRPGTYTVEALGLYYKDFWVGHTFTLTK